MTKKLAAVLSSLLFITACAQETQSLAGPNEAATAEQNCVLSPPPDAAERMCIMRYDPVCGCDGKTYSNGCVASVAGVPQTRPGACEQEQRLD